MLNKFIKYYQTNQLFAKTDKILLTVSGGVDSVFMSYLFLDLKLNFGIAHCNFKLRGKEADKDEQFVKDFAKRNQISFYSIDFNTKDFANKNRVSIQMAARTLRYNWFEEIRQEKGYDYIATAHHKNDVAETMLINLTKGTGLSGLHGIRSKHEKIIRPLLCFTRKEIINFVENNKIDFREDISNTETKYTRNRVRHKVISELEKINPNIIETLNNESKQFLELEQIIAQKIEEVKHNCCVYENDSFKISIHQLLALTPLKTYLYYLIKEFGFNGSDVDDIILGLKNQSGKIYESSFYQLLKDRAYLIISPKNLKVNLEFTIKSVNLFNNLPIKFKANIIVNSNDFQIDKRPQFAYLNLEKITFPLILRKWKKGDVFHPFGMKGKKKLSDFFIDMKLSLKEKEDVWVLVANFKIIWVIGYRIDNNFKVTNQTKRVLKLKIL